MACRAAAGLRRLRAPLLPLVLLAAGWAARAPAQAGDRAGGAGGGSFAALVERLSEPGGSFDTDNLLSNEASYLHVLDGLRRLQVRGGAYIGVGPDQNFSYIAQIRPEVAYIIDLRRDNVLLHLLFKALFAEAPTRIEYLSLLFGRPPPPDLARWGDRALESLIGWIDSTPGSVTATAGARGRVRARLAEFGLALSDADRATIERFHGTFIREGLDLRFTSTGRAPRPFYPTYRRLLLERDRSGRPGSFLAREDDYRFLRALQQRDGVVPVVGNLAGPHALEAIGRDAARRGLAVTALYASNVEFYLFGEGAFARYAATVRALPRTSHSVIIRSWFGGGLGAGHPAAVPGYGSVQLLQTMDAFVEGLAQGYGSYWDLVNRSPPLPPPRSAALARCAARSWSSPIRRPAAGGAARSG